ncbi:MAG: hypothetical protein GX545_02485 [Fibrobacter sp.]|jgi:hypothetical protein|nr:hypothetical protein [Fibrobacter sp.]
MKTKLIALITFVLNACALNSGYYWQQTKLKTEILQMDAYWEWGILQIKGSHVWSGGRIISEDEVVNSINEDQFCARYVGGEGKNIYGERIFIDSSGQLSFECSIGFENIFEDYRGGAFQIFIQLLDHQFDFVQDAGTQYRFSYMGDSLNLNVPQKRTGAGYEFFFAKNAPVLSITMRTDLDNLNDYKPLKINPKRLPLESPKYKALKASERQLLRPLPKMKKGD